MSAEQDSRQSSLSQAASAANTVKGAVKTGKAIANAARGAAGGPYGMIVVGLWENRRLIAIIIAVCLFLFILPVLLLPPLIFSNQGLDNAPAKVMNDNTLITDNIKEAETEIETILRWKHDALLDEIELEAQKLGENEEYSITDSFIDKIIFESTLIISQFCASQENYRDISLANLKHLLIAGTDEIFTYHVEVSEREEVVNQKTGETKAITHYEYIVDYAGDSFYADRVFCLDEDQLQLAAAYADNLHLFLYDTLYDIEVNPDLSFSEAGNTETGNAAVDLALTKLGTPYSQSLRDQGGYFDCSSFTYWVYSRLGLNLSYGGSNTAASQGRYIVDHNLVVSKENLLPGDLVFYSFKINNRYLNITHVAIYCGNGYVVDASSSKGKVVCRPIYSTNKIVLCGRPYANE